MPRHSQIEKPPETPLHRRIENYLREVFQEEGCKWYVLASLTKEFETNESDALAAVRLLALEGKVKISTDIRCTWDHCVWMAQDHPLMPQPDLSQIRCGVCGSDSFRSLTSVRLTETWEKHLSSQKAIAYHHIKEALHHEEALNEFRQIFVTLTRILGFAKGDKP